MGYSVVNVDQLEADGPGGAVQFMPSACSRCGIDW